MSKKAFHASPFAGGDFDYNPHVSVETSQKGFRDFWLRPVGGVTNQEGPFTFNIEPMVGQYIQINRAMLEVKCRVVKGDGSALHPVEDICAPINLLGCAMWDAVDVELNGQPFSGASTTGVSYKTLIDTLLSYDADSYNTHLQTQLFHLDSPQNYDEMKIKQSDFKKNCQMALESGRYAGPNYPDDEQLDARFAYLENGRLKSDQTRFQADLQELDADQIDLEDQLLIAENRMTRLNTWLNTYIVQRVDGQVAVEQRDVYNKGFGERSAVVRGSAEFDMYSPVPHDFFKINNNVGPGNRVQVRMTLARPEFIINSSVRTRGYKLQLLDMRMHLHTIERREAIPRPKIERYFMSESQLHKQIVPIAAPGATFRVHHGGVMPKNVIIAMTTTMAADGVYHRNPFNLQSFNVTNMSLLINGERYPTTGLEFDFEKPNALVARTYYWLFENTGVWNQEKGNVISWPAFKDGSFIVPFDLTPDKCNSLHNHMSEEGYIDLEIKFGTPLAEPIYVFYYMSFPKMIVNDSEGGKVNSYHLGDIRNQAL